MSGPDSPGRVCPISYRYSPRVFDRAPQIEADTLYVVGGVYGNVEALEALRDLIASESGAVSVVFNGDFHWFDVDARDFVMVDMEVARHAALRGNVETEISMASSGAGCGCAYPDDVGDTEVERSNRILQRLRQTALTSSAIRARLCALPMHITAQVGDARVGIVHGDATSLSGWGFARERVEDPDHRPWLETVFRSANVDIFASTHTCLPVFRALGGMRRACVIANNGAAGMPNFAGTRFGLATRISIRPVPTRGRIYGLCAGGVHIDAMRIDYDHELWMERFRAAWPDGSPAHESYLGRLCHGTTLSLDVQRPARAA